LVWQVLGTIVVSGGPWALVGLVVFGLVRGWLIPAPTHDRIVRSLERHLAAEERRAEEYRQQVGILLGTHVASGHGS
jgi:hypothetical protein